MPNKERAARRKRHAREKADRPLAEVEVTVILHASASAPVAVQLFLLFLVVTGQRLQEIATIDWSHIDWSENLWRRVRGKTGRIPFPLPLPSIIVDALLQRGPPPAHGPLFTPRILDQVRRVKMVIDQHIVEVGGPPLWKLQDLRRAFAMRCWQQGAEQGILEDIMGYWGRRLFDSKIVLPRQYRLDRMRAVLEAQGAFIEGILPPQYELLLGKRRLTL